METYDFKIPYIIANGVLSGRTGVIKVPLPIETDDANLMRILNGVTTGLNTGASVMSMIRYFIEAKNAVVAVRLLRATELATAGNPVLDLAAPVELDVVVEGEELLNSAEIGEMFAATEVAAESLLVEEVAAAPEIAAGGPIVWAVAGAIFGVAGAISLIAYIVEAVKAHTPTHTTSIILVNALPTTTLSVTFVDTNANMGQILGDKVDNITKEKASSSFEQAVGLGFSFSHEELSTGNFSLQIKFANDIKYPLQLNWSSNPNGGNQADSCTIGSLPGDFRNFVRASCKTTTNKVNNVIHTVFTYVLSPRSSAFPLLDSLFWRLERKTDYFWKEYTTVNKKQFQKTFIFTPSPPNISFYAGDDKAIGQFKVAMKPVAGSVRLYSYFLLSTSPDGKEKTPVHYLSLSSEPPTSFIRDNALMMWVFEQPNAEYETVPVYRWTKTTEENVYPHVYYYSTAQTFEEPFVNSGVVFHALPETLS